MNISAHWHSIVAMAIVIGAEAGGIKDETPAQLAAHTWVFWLILICAIIAAFGSTKIAQSSSTKSAMLQQMSAPDPKEPISPANPPAVAPQPNP